jgi:transketolase
MENKLHLDPKIDIKRLRYRILEINSISGEGHILSSLSSLELMIAILNVQRKKAHFRADSYPWEDPFILSKGHAALGFYVVLESLDLLEKNDLEEFGKFGSKLGGHPDSTKFPLAYFSTGSLGHGLPVSVGAAYSLANKGGWHKVYCLCGDGELMEGAIWESLAFASAMKLSNLQVLVDCNSTHTKNGVSIESLTKRLSGYDLEIVVVNGHNLDELNIILETPQKNTRILLCETKMGNGVPLVEGKKEWHRKKISTQELANVKVKLGIE